MVFTGDHLNSPPLIATLEEKVCSFLPIADSWAFPRLVSLVSASLVKTQGVLSKGRADSLRQIPLLECDVLLHEAGAPPIHTPISVLQELPEEVRERLYIVHTSALPPDCGLRVAPTGTAGTIRLDQRRKGGRNGRLLSVGSDNGGEISQSITSARGHNSGGGLDIASLDDGGHPSMSIVGAYHSSPSLADLVKMSAGERKLPPLVFLRPTCVSDAWFILNLLSAVPFFSRYVVDVLFSK